MECSSERSLLTSISSEQSVRLATRNNHSPLRTISSVLYSFDFIDLSIFQR